MKIGIIADIHIPISTPKFPPKIHQYFKDCDLIIHAGDAVEMDVIKELEKIAQTKAVWGNMDSPEIREKLPEKIVFEADGKTIGVIHGRGASSKVIEMVKKAFRKKPDIIIFGHTHTPINKTVDGTLYFNPGSPTDRTFSPYRSLGIIKIDNGNINAEIIKLED